MFKLNALQIKSFIKDILFILFGVMSASLGLVGFLLPNGFFDGGAIGIALLLKHFLNYDLSVFILLVNIPFILIGFRQISVSFAIKSTIAMFLLAIVVHYLKIDAFTSDKLLISIFGGVFLGAGIGLTIRGGAVIDGSEVLAVQISRKSSLSVGDFIALFNLALFLGVAFLINIETAMYSMLTYVSASKTVDFILNGVEEYIGVTIISPKYKQIREVLINNLRRGVTVYKIQGGYGKRGVAEDTDQQALYCVVTRLEVSKLLLEVEKLDASAFVIQSSVKDTKGGMIKKRPLHD